MLENLTFKSFLYKSSRRTNRRITRVLASKTGLKMHCRSSSKYLMVKDIADNIAESFKAKLKAGLEAKSPLEIRDLFNSSILLLIREKTGDVALDKVEGATKA